MNINLRNLLKTGSLILLYAFGNAPVEKAQAWNTLPALFGSVVGCLPGNNATTKLLVHSNTTEGSTTFEDSSQGGEHTSDITANGDVQHKIAQKKFGASAIYFDGTGDYLTIADDADWNFAAGDFTLEAWVRLDFLSGESTFFFMADDAANYFVFYYLGGTGMYFAADNAGANTIALNVGDAGSWNANEWTHIALVRSGNDFIAFRSGTSVDSTVAAVTLPDLADDLGIGQDSDVGGVSGDDFGGYMDEVLVWKGFARYTDDFTPNEIPYCD